MTASCSLEYPLTNECRNRSSRKDKGASSGWARSICYPLVKMYRCTSVKGACQSAREVSAMFEHACNLGLKGIVSKHEDRAYRSGRSPH
jgi:hypothetical protein